MRKTRLVIQPKRCLHTIGFLLLYLSCPVVGDWGLIQPDTDMAHRAVAVQREGTRTLIKDPPSLTRRVTVDGHRTCRPSETWTRALETKNRHNWEATKSTRRMVDEERMALGERRVNRWLDVRNQRLSAERRNGRADDVRGQTFRRMENAREQELRRIIRSDTRREKLSVNDIRNTSTRREKDNSDRDIERTNTGRNLRELESRRSDRFDARREQSNLEASRERSLRRAENSRERDIDRLNARREIQSVAHRTLRRVEHLGERHMTRTNRLSEQRETSRLDVSRHLSRSYDNSQKEQNIVRQGLHRSDTPSRRLLRDRIMENNSLREQSETDRTLRQQTRQDRVLKASPPRADKQMRREINMQRRLLKARSVNNVGKENKEPTDNNRKVAARVSAIRLTRSISAENMRNGEGRWSDRREQSSVLSDARREEIGNRIERSSHRRLIRITDRQSSDNEHRVYNIRQNKVQQRSSEQNNQRNERNVNERRAQEHEIRRDIGTINEDIRSRTRRQSESRKGSVIERRETERADIQRNIRNIRSETNDYTRRFTRMTKEQVRSVGQADLDDIRSSRVERNLARQENERQERSIDRVVENNRRSPRGEMSLNRQQNDLTRSVGRVAEVEGSLNHQQSERQQRSVDRIAENDRRSSRVVRSLNRQQSKRHENSVDRVAENNRRSTRVERNLLRQQSERHERSADRVADNNRRSSLVESRRESEMRTFTKAYSERRELSRAISRQEKQDISERREKIIEGITAAEKSRRGTEVIYNRAEKQRHVPPRTAAHEVARMLPEKIIRQTRREKQEFFVEKPYPQEQVAAMFAAKQEKWSTIMDLAANCALGAMVWYITSRNAKSIH